MDKEENIVRRGRLEAYSKAYFQIIYGLKLVFKRIHSEPSSFAVSASDRNITRTFSATQHIAIVKESTALDV